jgi:hypothetical protein
MTQLGEKSIFVQIRATVRDRERLDKVIKNSSHEGRGEWLRMIIKREWKLLPKEKQ